MEEKTLFKLARAITDTGTDTVSSKGGTVTYRITSLKRKLVNGKVVLTSTPSCTLASTPVSWATWGGVTVGEGYLDVKINYSENTGSSRSTTLTFDQNGSNNKINLTVTQGSGVTYTDYLEVPSQLTSLGSTKGSTLTIKVISYSLGSDGSKVAKSPSVGAAPSWANQVLVGQMTGDHEYPITFTATETNSSTTTRRESALITCGTAKKSIFIDQEGQLLIKRVFTLTGLPDKPCYLFASGSRPQNGVSGAGYLMIQGLSDGQVTMMIPVTVNLSTHGEKTTADTGDEVTVWTYSGSTFSRIGSFTVPRAGETVSI